MQLVNYHIILYGSQNTERHAYREHSKAIVVNFSKPMLMNAYCIKWVIAWVGLLNYLKMISVYYSYIYWVTCFSNIGGMMAVYLWTVSRPPCFMYNLPAKAILCFAIITWEKCDWLWFIGFDQLCLSTSWVSTAGVHICQNTWEKTVCVCMHVCFVRGRTILLIFSCLFLCMSLYAYRANTCTRMKMCSCIIVWIV